MRNETPNEHLRKIGQKKHLVRKSAPMQHTFPEPFRKDSGGNH